MLDGEVVPDSNLSEQHEMFARCLGAGNNPLLCYYTITGKWDREVAERLADREDFQPSIYRHYKKMFPNGTARKPQT